MLGIAAYQGRTEASIVDVPDPAAPLEGEVLCRTLQVGICGTDREILHSTAPVTPPGSAFLVLGHECLARVEVVGPGVTRLKPGDLVTPLVRRAHRVSNIRVDMLAFGEFVERGIYLEHGFSTPWWLDRPEYLLLVPPAIRDVAILTEPLSVVEKAVNEALTIQQARLAAGTWTTEPPRVLVTGLGPIGFAGVLACVARDWPVEVYGRDQPDSFRASLMAELGGTYRNDLAPPHDLEQHGYDLVLECTGSDQVAFSAAALMRSRAVMAWLGSERLPETQLFNLGKLIRDGLIRNQIFVGCVNSAPRDFEDALLHLGQLDRKHGVALRKLLTDRVLPHESLWHYTRREPQGIKVVLEYE